MADMRDEYGNPNRQTDEYGNPVRHTQGGTMGSYGTTPGDYGATGFDPTTGYGTQGTGTGGGPGSGGFGGGHGDGHVGGTGGHMQEHRVGEGGGHTGMLQRSGSSSSSEDDGYGGRRKKGLKEKIKEKIPGVGGKEKNPRHTHIAHGNPPPAMGQHSTYGQPHHQEYYGHEGREKKGILEKIKEKLPGGGRRDV